MANVNNGKNCYFMYYLSVIMTQKTLIVSLVYYPEFVGGAEVAVGALTDRLSEQRFDMIVLIGNSSLRKEIVGRINVHRVGWRVDHHTTFGKIVFAFQKLLFPFMVFVNGSSLMKENRYDIIWSIMANYAGFGALFLKLAFPKVKFLLTLQEGDPISYIKRRVALVYPLFKLIFLRANAVQAISNYLARFAVSMGAKNVTVIPNGFDSENFRSEEYKNTSSDIRIRFNIARDDIVLVTTSRLVEKNGIIDVLGAMALLPPKYKFIIIGEGKLRQSLESFSSSRGIIERVYFVGFIPHTEIPKYFSISDIFIRTSLSEGLGNSFLEAMAFGLPIVATPVGGIVDFLEDGVTGVSVTPGNKESIAHGIILLEDEAFKARISSTGMKLARESYDWDKIAIRFGVYMKQI